MRTEKDVEAYLFRLKRRFMPIPNDHEGGPTTYLVESSKEVPPIAIRVDTPLVIMRAHVGDAPDGGHEALFRKLLQLNAKALVHTAFGLEDDRVVLSAALELENLDFNELEATLDELDMALAQHAPLLAELRKMTQGKN